MTYEFQVAIDCARPHELADWWAETLGWNVEQQDEDFIRRMIAEGYATDQETTRHQGRLVWQEGAAIRHPDAAGGVGYWPRVLFQQVPEPKTVKNRAHLDIRIRGDDLETVVAALAERGASELHRARQGPHLWVTMADPEGNEFCVSP